MASESWVQAVWGGATRPYSENEFNVRNLLSYDIYLRKHLMHDYNGHEAMANMPKSKKCLKFFFCTFIAMGDKVNCFMSLMSSS